MIIAIFEKELTALEVLSQLLEVRGREEQRNAPFQSAVLAAFAIDLQHGDPLFRPYDRVKRKYVYLGGVAILGRVSSNNFDLRTSPIDIIMRYLSEDDFVCLPGSPLIEVNRKSRIHFQRALDNRDMLANRFYGVNIVS